MVGTRGLGGQLPGAPWGGCAPPPLSPQVGRDPRGTLQRAFSAVTVGSATSPAEAKGHSEKGGTPSGEHLMLRPVALGWEGSLGVTPWESAGPAKDPVPGSVGLFTSHIPSLDLPPGLPHAEEDTPL